MACLHHCCLLPIFLLSIVVLHAHEEAPKMSTLDDLSALLSFKSTADPLGKVLHTWEGLNPCLGSWIGIRCHRRRVVTVHLDGASLAGRVTPLLGLSQLQVLSVRRNALSGPLPPLTNLTNPRLQRLYLSHNHLNGTLSIFLPRLRILRIENNSFSGGLTGVHLPAVEDFDVSANSISGEIPGPLSRFPGLAFGGNDPSLCGAPLPTCDQISRLTSSSISPASPNVPENENRDETVSKVSLGMLLVIGIGDILAIALALATIIGLYLWLRKKLLVALSTSTRIEEYNNEADRERNFQEDEVKEKDRGLVCFQGGEDLMLEHLLKASAEVMGKGISGSTYKAVLDDGIIVAVKRLSAVQFPSQNRKDFDKQMRAIGRVRHPNIVTLRAYCNAHEEKLLVYDYMPNGSLQSLLHNASGGTNLDWVTRKQILEGIAQGLNFLHTFPARSPLVHANIKPSNILIDEQGNACLAEWGIMSLATNFHQSLMVSCASSFFSERMAFPEAATNRRGYVAPELLNGREKPSQETDVYSFGMVLVEMVTGKEVDERECESEIMGMAKIGMMCTAECPAERPKMSQVLRMLSELL